MVYEVQQGERNVYCSSPQCIAELLKTGWRLSNASQLTPLVQELAKPATGTPHDPTDHFR